MKKQIYVAREVFQEVLDFLAPHTKGQILIGESGFHNTMDGFKAYGYLPLEKEYNVKIVDLNLDAFQHRYILGLDNKPTPIRIINTFLDPDIYLISLAPMKTHNYVFVTLSLKNVLMASPLNDYKTNDKGLMHQAPPARHDLLHFNMFHMAREVWPDLAIIDGFEGMEGNGPASGTPVASRVAIASTDFIAADRVGVECMGINPLLVAHLQWCWQVGIGQYDLGKIDVRGDKIADVRRVYLGERFSL